MSEVPSTPSYDEIKHLGGLSHIRQRPGMYVGDFHGNEYNSAPMNLAREAVGNSVDEFMNGHATTIKVVYDQATNKLSVSDDGRGIPFGPTEYEDPVSKVKYPMDKLELATCVPNTGAKYDKGDEKSFKFAIGLNGIGIKAVNALSNTFTITSVRSKTTATLTCHKGIKAGDVQTSSFDSLSDSPLGQEHGTRIEWILDDTIIPFEYSAEHLRKYLHEVAYLNAGIRVTLKVITADGSEKNNTYFEPEGLASLARKIIGDQTVIIDFPVMFGEEEKGSKYEIVLKVLEGAGETTHAYVNGGAIETASAPVAAMRQAYARAVASVYKEWPKLKKFEKLEVKTDDFRTGLLGIVKILHVDPAYDAQTKTKLINTDIASTIQQDLPNQIKAFMLANPQQTQVIIDQAIKMAVAREAADKARKEALKDAERISKNTGPISLDIYTPPLTDDPDLNSLYLFEGQSASGSLIKAAKQRDPESGKLYKEHVGVLALKGNVLNALEADISKALKNVELATLIKVAGLNPADPSDLSKIKFKRFVIATDQDSGGSHIATLLVSFFLAHFPEIIRQGMLFRVITPLFEVTDLKTKAKHFIYHDEDREKALNRFGYSPEDSGKKYNIKRNKGLGEMSDEGNMTLVRNPRLQSFQTNDIASMLKLYMIFSGKDYVSQRRDVIFERGLLVED